MLLELDFLCFFFLYLLNKMFKCFIDYVYLKDFFKELWNYFICGGFKFKLLL